MNEKIENLEDFLNKYGQKLIVVDEDSIESKIMMSGSGAHSVDFNGKPKKGTKKPKNDGFDFEEDEDEYDAHGISVGDKERKVLTFLSGVDDEKFDSMYQENTDDESAEELKVLFDVGFAFARRALTNRRKKKKKGLFKDGKPENIETKVAPCWNGYVQVGMKKSKKGKMVPNCVPEGQQKSFFLDSETKSAKKKIRDPKGGLTAAGRAYFKRKEGANLKPGVKGAANTPEKMRRKGSFLTRFFTNPSGPMKDEKGRPTRLALSAAAWGEPVPQNASDAAELAAKGRRMLERYENSKKK